MPNARIKYESTRGDHSNFRLNGHVTKANVPTSESGTFHRVSRIGIEPVTKPLIVACKVSKRNVYSKQLNLVSRQSVIHRIPNTRARQSKVLFGTSDAFSLESEPSI